MLLVLSTLCCSLAADLSYFDVLHQYCLLLGLQGVLSFYDLWRFDQPALYFTLHLEGFFGCCFNIEMSLVLVFGGSFRPVNVYRLVFSVWQEVAFWRSESFQLIFVSYRYSKTFYQAHSIARINCIAVSKMPVNVMRASHTLQVKHPVITFESARVNTLLLTPFVLSKTV